MSAWAKPGVKCVCIHPGNWRSALNHAPQEGPSTNQICTIVWVGRGSVTGRTVIEIEGFPGSFVLASFRPLVPLDTKIEQDVALFNHHLDNQPIQKEKTNEPA